MNIMYVNAAIYLALAVVYIFIEEHRKLVISVGVLYSLLAATYAYSATVGAH